MADKKKSSVKFKNFVRLVGILADYDLVEETRNNKKTGDPYDVIRGNIVIDTGNNNTHNINAFYMAKWPNGNTNGNYTVAKRILDGDQDGEKHSIGMRIQLSASFEENSFVTNGELIKTNRVGGGFLETNPQRLGTDKAEFNVDALIEKELIPEVRDGEETGKYFLDVEVANYKGLLYPLRTVVENPAAIDFFNDLEKPSVLEIWGDVINSTTTIRHEEENAFGEPRIVEQTRTNRENLVKGASVEAREMTEVLQDVIKKGKQDYKVVIAQKEDEAKNAGGNAFAGSTTKPSSNVSTPKAGEFNF